MYLNIILFKYPFLASYCNINPINFSGGISIKPSADMDKMRADMGGAACVVGSILAASSLKLKVNVKGELMKNIGSGLELAWSEEYQTRTHLIYRLLPSPSVYSLKLRGSSFRC